MAASASRGSVRGQVGDPRLVTQPLPPTDLPSQAAAPTVRRRGFRWLVRLLRTYLTAALLLVGLVLAATPTPAEAPPGYRVETINPAEQGGPSGLPAWLLGVTAWGVDQAAQRQADLLQPSPLATRLLAPAATSFAVWLQAHRVWVVIPLGVGVAGLIFYGVLTRPTRRWWLATVLLVVVGSVTVNFPTPVLTMASAPGLAATRQVVNLTHTTLPNPSAERAEQIQTRLAERFWTAFVTLPHSRLTTNSTVLAHLPAQNRGNTVAYLHTQGVNQPRGLHGAAISTSGLLNAAPFALAIAAASIIGAAAQTLLLLLNLTGLALVPLLTVTGRVRALLTWWLLPTVASLVLAGLAGLVSVGLTELAVAAVAALETIASLIASAVLLTVTVAGWWGYRKTRRLLRRHTTPAAHTPTTPAGTAPARREGAA